MKRSIDKEIDASFHSTFFWKWFLKVPQITSDTKIPESAKCIPFAKKYLSFCWTNWLIKQDSWTYFTDPTHLSRIWLQWTRKIKIGRAIAAPTDPHDLAPPGCQKKSAVLPAGDGLRGKGTPSLNDHPPLFSMPPRVAGHRRMSARWSSRRPVPCGSTSWPSLSVRAFRGRRTKAEQIPKRIIPKRLSMLLAS